MNKSEAEKQAEAVDNFIIKVCEFSNLIKALDKIKAFDQASGFYNPNIVQEHKSATGDALVQFLDALSQLQAQFEIPAPNLSESQDSAPEHEIADNVRRILSRLYIVGSEMKNMSDEAARLREVNYTPGIREQLDEILENMTYCDNSINVEVEKLRKISRQIRSAPE
jgi:hypothetical protein